MTHSGGKAHAVGYRGQPFVVSVWDDDAQARIVVGWKGKMMKWAEMRALETRPGWTCARCEPVKDTTTGDPPP